MYSSPAILVAEDDPNDALLFQCALAKTGFSGPIHVVCDGNEARQYLLGLGAYADRKRFPLPRMMVVDLMMPRCGGFQLLEWARSQPFLNDVFILVLTGVDQRGIMDRAYQLGANLYVVKPLTFSALAEVVANAATAGVNTSADNLVSA